MCRRRGFGSLGPGHGHVRAEGIEGTDRFEVPQGPADEADAGQCGQGDDRDDAERRGPQAPVRHLQLLCAPTTGCLERAWM